MVKRFLHAMLPLMFSTRRRIGFAVAAVWAVTALLHSAETSTNPYEPIVARNPFGIKEPPPKPPDQPLVPQVPLPKVMLTGIHSMFGPPSALLEITETEPGKAANVKRPILRQGEKDGSVEIVSIDVTNNSVRIRNGGIETNLVFEVAKASPTPGPAMAMAPGMVPGLNPQPHPGLPTPPPVPAYPGALTPPPGSLPGANAPGRAGSSVTTYGATSSTGSDRPLPTRMQPTVTGSDLLRESARARGLPVPPLPGAPGR